jgi:thiamine-monophosphate kinase
LSEVSNVPLDEPSKLAQIVVPAMGDEMLSVSLMNGAKARLVLGAKAQDDCAAFELSGTQVLVAGSDYVRGVKFALYEMGFLDDYDIGWYLAGANISDIAAMGAVPLGLLSVVRYPKNLPDDRFAALIKGIRDGAHASGAFNVGGDIGSAERIILSASAFGTVEPSSLLTRTGAREGQVVCITGPTGLAGSAMKLVRAGNLQTAMQGSFEPLLQKWRRVEPRVGHGRLFAQSDAVTSCMDTSDGLKGALCTLAEASKVAIHVHEDLLPIHQSVSEAAELLGCDVLDLVFGDSVDFELVATVDADAAEELIAQSVSSGLDLHPIGVVSAGSNAWIRRGDVSEELPGEAWRHG